MRTSTWGFFICTGLNIIRCSTCGLFEIFEERTPGLHFLLMTLLSVQEQPGCRKRKWTYSLSSLSLCFLSCALGTIFVPSSGGGEDEIGIPKQTQMHRNISLGFEDHDHYNWQSGSVNFEGAVIHRVREMGLVKLGHGDLPVPVVPCGEIRAIRLGRRRSWNSK